MRYNLYIPDPIGPEKLIGQLQSAERIQFAKGEIFAWKSEAGEQVYYRIVELVYALESVATPPEVAMFMAVAGIDVYLALIPQSTKDPIVQQPQAPKSLFPAEV